MNRTFTSFALSVLSVVTMLADTSHTFGPLRDSALFRSRVTFIIAMQAPVVLSEASNVPCHGLRAVLAASVSGNPQNYAGVFSANVVTNINVTSAGALTGSGNTLDSPITDAALLAAVASQWSQISGCVVNP